LLDRGVVLDERELGASPMTVAELDRLIGTRDHREFLNSRNDLYRERGMKQNPPPRPEALRLMSEHPNLIKRPILIVGGRAHLGFDDEQWKELFR
jgi:arsenate reductase-like glutaredoxin family protein